MPEVSTWFNDLLYNQSIDNVSRRFCISDSDYSDYVLRWPRFRNHWNQMRPNNITINLSNEDKLFNFFRDDKTKLKSIAKVQLVGEGPVITSPNSLGDTSVWSLGSGAYWSGSDTLCDSSGTANTRLYAIPYELPYGGHQTRVQMTVKQNSDASSHYSEFRMQRETDAGSWQLIEYRFMNNVNTSNIELQACDVDSANTYISETWVGSDLYFDVNLMIVWSSDPALINSAQVWIRPAPGWFDGSWIETNSAKGCLEVYNCDIYHHEIVDIFQGVTDNVSYRDTSVSVSISDKFKQLSERVVGTSDVPVNFTGSSYLPSDLAWWLCTSYGGYSAIESASNPDIDYEAFANWANIFSDSGIYMEALFDGQKVTECLRKIGRMTRSAIHVANNKVDFHRFSLADTNQCDVGEDCLTKFELNVDDSNMVNRQYVFADYLPSSDFFQISAVDASTASVNSFGVKEDIEQDKNVWYVDSVGALDLIQRILLVRGIPYDQVKVTTGMKGLVREVGETVSIIWPHLNVAAGYRIMSHDMDLENMQATMMTDRSQLLPGFILDTSSLNGDDILT